MSPSIADFIEHPRTDPPPFRLGEWLVSPGSGEITDGRSVLRVEPKAMDVLVCLAARPGEVVSREELERNVWHGALVGYDAVTNTVVKLRKALGDDPHRPTYIATVPKRRYRLLPGVESHSEPGWDVPTGAIQQRHRNVGDDPAHPRALLTSSDGGSRLVAPVSAADRSLALEGERALDGSISGARRLIPAVLLFFALVLAAAGAFVWFGDYQPPVATKGTPSDLKTIAVLPFRNLTGDAADNYFAEGMGDDLIASLARFSNLRVIARDSSSLYADAPASLRDVADRLNARYLLRGSVRRTAARLRTSVQLVDAHSGRTL
jgi:TolB-like protein/DNA-binding winged helix-turn-helix (wHTH) protein